MPFKGVLVICLLLSGCTGFTADCPLKLGEPLCSWSRK
jgi:hypothetical protein